MGAEYFENYSWNPDPQKAFNERVDQAAWDYGHSGYTGTIAEKNRFETVSATPMEEGAALEQWAYKYCEEHNHDKWGPAWHVPVCDKEGKIIGHFFFGYASS